MDFGSWGGSMTKKLTYVNMASRFSPFGDSIAIVCFWLSDSPITVAMLTPVCWIHRSWCVASRELYRCFYSTHGLVQRQPKRTVHPFTLSASAYPGFR